MSNDTQVDIVQKRLAVLRAEMDAVQKKLDGAETGLRGWWRGTSLSPHQFNALTEEKRTLFKAINAHTAEVAELLAPTKLQIANEFRKELTKLLEALSARLATLSFGGVAFWSTWRYWSILRRRFAPLTKEQWYWRKNWLRVESPYPPAVKGIASVSAAYLVYYYSRHPRELEQWGPQLRPTQTDRVVVQ